MLPMIVSVPKLELGCTIIIYYYDSQHNVYIEIYNFRQMLQFSRESCSTHRDVDKLLYLIRTNDYRIFLEGKRTNLLYIAYIYTESIINLIVSFSKCVIVMNWSQEASIFIFF